MKWIVTHGDETHSVEVSRAGRGYRVVLGERTLDVDLVHAGRLYRSLRFADGAQHLIVHHADGPKHTLTFGDSLFELDVRDPLALRSGRSGEDGGGEGRVTAMMPGRVVRLTVEAGQEVAKGDPLMVLEAMKMENAILAPRAGTVTEVFVAAGATVEKGSPLLVIE